MADEEQVKRLKQGVEGWNSWREENPDIKIELRRANLTGADLGEVDLLEADLAGADLIGTNLQEASLHGADLEEADLGRANLEGARLAGADLRGANLSEANLRGANLWRVDLRRAYLRGANLFGSNLILADLCEADLQRVDLNRAILGGTVWGNVDLGETKGLEGVRYIAPSTLGTDTLQLSKGKIPAKFLRGCGLSDWEIESAKLYQTGLSTKEVNDIVYRICDLRANQAIQINPLFISYSHKDRAFVDEMEKHLDEKGVRFWRDIHDATAGRLERVVDRAIRQNPIVLLILSEHSVKSDWVEHEARTARELEKELGRDVLCPVTLDGAWKDCKWPERLREQIMEYNILDFSKWKDGAEFAKMFRKLVDGLDLYYKE